MDTTNLHITEYRGNQEISFFDISSFKVQNHGEATVEINTIPIYPGQTLKIIEEDSTKCDFKMIAKFTEEGKIQKLRAIYKQVGNADSVDHLHTEQEYKVTLYNYGQGDIVDFSQNIAGSTTLTRSFDGGVSFLTEHDIDLGFVEANQIVKYDLGGSLNTSAIQFRNNDLEVNSEIFRVDDLEVVPPFEVSVVYGIPDYYIDPQTFTTSVDGDIVLMYKIYNDEVWREYPIGLSTANVEKAIDFSQAVGEVRNFMFRNVSTNQTSPSFAIGRER